MSDLDGLDDIINGLASGDEAGPADADPAGYDSAEEVRALEELRRRSGKGAAKPAKEVKPRVKPLEKWLKDEILAEIERLKETADTPQRADFVKELPELKKLKKPKLKTILQSMWKIGMGGPDEGPLVDPPVGPSVVADPPPAAEPETVYVAAKPDRNVLDPPRKSRRLEGAALDQIGEQMAGFNLIVMHTIEGVSQQLQPSGYVISGAAEKLAQPEMFHQVKECMKEIAADVGPDDPVIKTVSNPWFKYAVLMTSVVAGSAKKVVPEVGPPPEAAGTARP